MTAPLTCSECGTPLEIRDGTEAPWLECPHCGARVLNAHALRHTGPERLTWLGLLGSVLLLLSVCLWCGGAGAIFSHAIVARNDEEPPAGLCIHTVGSLMLFAVGTLVLRAREDRLRKPFLLAAAGITLLAAVALLAFSGLIVIYVTCFVKA